MTGYSGDHSAVVLPDSIPNSEVKCCNADGSVGFPHVRVGHRQVLNVNPELKSLGFLFLDFILINKKCGQNQNSFIKDV